MLFIRFHGVNLENNTINNQVHECQKLGQTDETCQSIVQELNRPN